MPLFDAAAVEPIDEHRFRVEIAEGYTVFGKPNGGYLQCVLANAAIAAASENGAPHVHATAVATNFISPPDVGPAMLSTRVRRVGRSASFVTVTLSQGDTVCTESVITVGTLSEFSSPRYQSSSIVIAPLIDALTLPPVEGMTVHGAVDIRWDPQGPRWWEGAFGSTGELRAWIRLTDGASIWNAWNILLASDVLLPATLPLGSTGWVPTLQLTSYVHQIPASEWLHARQWITSVADGMAHEQCELFDDSGALVASSSQLALVRFQHGA